MCWDRTPQTSTDLNASAVAHPRRTSLQSWEGMSTRGGGTSKASDAERGVLHDGWVEQAAPPSEAAEPFDPEGSKSPEATAAPWGGARPGCPWSSARKGLGNPPPGPFRFFRFF